MEPKSGTRFGGPTPNYLRGADLNKWYALKRKAFLERQEDDESEIYSQFAKARRLMTQPSRIPGANPLLQADPYQQTYLRNPNETFTLGSSKYASPKRSAKDFIDLSKSYSEFDKIPVDQYHGLNIQRNYLGEPIGSDLVQEAKLNRREKTELGILQGQKEMESTYGPLTPEQEERIKELLKKELEV